MPKTIQDWKYVQIFGMAIMEEADIILKRKGHFHRKIMGERMAVLRLAHANELLMKAFLMREGYIVTYLRENDVRAGIQSSDVEEKTLTLTYGECLRLVLNHLLRQKKITEAKKKEIIDELMKFYKIRNEIQHSSMSAELEKSKWLIRVYPYLNQLFDLMFPDDDFKFYPIHKIEREIKKSVSVASKRKKKIT